MRGRVAAFDEVDERCTERDVIARLEQSFNEEPVGLFGYGRVRADVGVGSEEAIGSRGGLHRPRKSLDPLAEGGEGGPIEVMQGEPHHEPYGVADQRWRVIGEQLAQRLPVGGEVDIVGGRGSRRVTASTTSMS